MPIGLDIKIRLRIFREFFNGRRNVLSAFGAGLLVPVIASYLFVFNSTEAPPPIDTQAIVSAVYEAQAAEIAKSETGIYHIKRIIKEGHDKSAFVALYLGERAPKVTERVDEVETWQHNDTALALIESNGTERSFEAYLSRERDGELGLYHYGPKDQTLKEDRKAYDEAHDLATLYTEYTSLKRPGVPVLPEGALLKKVDAKIALFVYKPAEVLEVEAVVDMETKLVTQEIIYVLDDAGNRFEMTTVRYTDRSVIPAEKFEQIFDPMQFAYVQIS